MSQHEKEINSKANILFIHHLLANALLGRERAEIWVVTFDSTPSHISAQRAPFKLRTYVHAEVFALFRRHITQKALSSSRIKLSTTFPTRVNVFYRPPGTVNYVCSDVHVLHPFNCCGATAIVMEFYQSAGHSISLKEHAVLSRAQFAVFLAGKDEFIESLDSGQASTVRVDLLSRKDVCAIQAGFDFQCIKHFESLD